MIPDRQITNADRFDLDDVIRKVRALSDSAWGVNVSVDLRRTVQGRWQAVAVSMANPWKDIGSEPRHDRQVGNGDTVVGAAVDLMQTMERFAVERRSAIDDALTGAAPKKPVIAPASTPAPKKGRRR
jgi:hypothetical protein